MRVEQVVSARGDSEKFTEGMQSVHVRNELKKGNTDKFADADHAAKVAAKKATAALADGVGALSIAAAAEVEAAGSGVAEAVVYGEPATASEPAAVASTEVSAGGEGVWGRRFACRHGSRGLMHTMIAVLGEGWVVRRAACSRRCRQTRHQRRSRRGCEGYMLDLIHTRRWPTKETATSRVARVP